MPVNIVVPQLGESVVEATVAEWLKKQGDPVAVGDPLVRLETDKVDLEVGADQPGVLERIERQAGADVKVGDVLGVIAEKAVSGQAATPAATAVAPGGDTSHEGAGAGKPAAAPARGTDGQPAAPAAGREAPSQGQPQATASDEPAAAPEVTPVARRVAEEMGVDLAHITGSGPKGRVTKEDVESYVQSAATAGGAGARPSDGPAAPASAAQARPPEPAAASRAPSEAQPAAGQTHQGPTLPVQPAPQPGSAAVVSPAPGSEGRRETRERMSRRRQTIARRLVEAQHSAAMLTTFNEIDMTAVMEIRKRRKDAFRERYGVNLGLTSFFVKAAIGGLRAFPRLNAEIQGDEMILKSYYDIGIAVGAAEGLVVPVFRDADRAGFASIEQQVKAFADKAQKSTLTLEDLRGGTFTITNGGVFGSLMSTPILNPPQVGILGLHKIEERPVVREGQVVVRPMMYVALSYDHRIVDGREAVQFLVRVKELIEDPETLLLEG